MPKCRRTSFLTPLSNPFQTTKEAMNKAKQYEVASSILNTLDIRFTIPADHCFSEEDVIDVPNIGKYEPDKLIDLLEYIANMKDVDYRKVNAAIGSVWKEWIEAFDSIPIQTFTEDGKEIIYYAIEPHEMMSRMMSLWGKLSPGLVKNASIQIDRFSYSWSVEFSYEGEQMRDYFEWEECTFSATALHKTADLFNWAMRNEVIDKRYTLRSFLDWYDELGHIFFCFLGVAPTFHVTEPESISIEPYAKN